MSAPPTTRDVVNAILGVDDDSPIATLRNQKPDQVAGLQHYYETIFQPEEPSAEQFSVADRALVAIRVAAHTGSDAVVAWYEDLARSSDVSATEIARARDTATEWSDDSIRGAAIRRADRITVDPASAEREHIDELTAAGLTPAAIVSLSQVIAFVSYQVRFIAILRALGGAA